MDEVPSDRQRLALELGNALGELLVEVEEALLSSSLCLPRLLWVVLSPLLKELSRLNTTMEPSERDGKTSLQSSSTVDNVSSANLLCLIPMLLLYHAAAEAPVRCCYRSRPNGAATKAPRCMLSGSRLDQLVFHSDHLRLRSGAASDLRPGLPPQQLRVSIGATVSPYKRLGD